MCSCTSSTLGGIQRCDFCLCFLFALMLQSMAWSIEDNWVSADGCGDDDTIERVGLLAQVSADKLVIVLYITGLLPVCGTNEAEGITQEYLTTEINHPGHASMQLITMSFFTTSQNTKNYWEFEAISLHFDGCQVQLINRVNSNVKRIAIQPVMSCSSHNAGRRTPRVHNHLISR